jgi:murein DD-endopeptidase MepM/ murein hydrolase activator NlpD
MTLEVDAAGDTFRGKGGSLEDYLIFGKPVLAPAAGTVVRCVDGRPDSPIGEWLVDYEELMRTKDLWLLGGNHIVVDHGNGEFSYFAHLRKGSLKVHKGARIAAGQQIAEVGNSGDSSEPHLHYQLQSGYRSDFESIPAVFRNFKRHYGSRVERVEAGVVDTGDIVEGL